MVQDVKCSKCGGKVCVCSVDDMWTAHCMDCDNEIRMPCFSEEDAYDLWVEENSPEIEEDMDSRGSGMEFYLLVFVIVAMLVIGFTFFCVMIT